MDQKLIFILLSVLALSIAGVGTVLAGDLDDGISKYNEDGINKWEEMGKPEKNTKFIIMKSKSAAGKSGGAITGQTGGTNMNSVVMGAGSNVKGDVIIIDQSSGPKTQVTGN
jgi:hypothetical protein